MALVRCNDMYMTRTLDKADMHTHVKTTKTPNAFSQLLCFNELPQKS